MEIIASSIQNVANTFLHAGYMSSAPAQYSLGTDAFTQSDPILQLNIYEALQLKHSFILAEFPADGGHGFAAITQASNQWELMTIGTILFFLAMLLFYVVRRNFSGVRWGFALTASLIIALFGFLKISEAVTPSVAASYIRGNTDQHHAAKTRPPTTPPWEDVRIREYVNPEDATNVLLHGLIADAIAAYAAPFETLASIQHEVMLPVKTPTKSTAYALKTYGIDGWGNPFRLKGDYWKGYTVTSSGADGRFNTSDDLSTTVHSKNGYWRLNQRSFYLARDGGECVVIFRKGTGKNIRYSAKNHNRAQLVTGSVHYDLFDEKDLKDEIGAVVYNIDSWQVVDDCEPVVLTVCPQTGEVHKDARRHFESAGSM